jgi:hypothetical protein
MDLDLPSLITTTAVKRQLLHRLLRFKQLSMRETKLPARRLPRQCQTLQKLQRVHHRFLSLLRVHRALRAVLETRPQRLRHRLRRRGQLHRVQRKQMALRPR